MSLENLKSVFSNLEKFNRSDLTDVDTHNSEFGNIDDNENKPFKGKLSGLDNYSPLYDNDKIGEVDYFDNRNAPGFSKDFDTNLDSKYISESSTLDNLPGGFEDGFGERHFIEYSKDKKYEDINKTPLQKLGENMDNRFGNLQFNPLADDVDGYDDIASNSNMTNFTDLPLKNYDEYTFDPREEKTNVLPEGQTNVLFPNPQNPYTGTKFDDPLVEGIDGGGLFNSITDDDTGKYSNVFRTINVPFMNQIINVGNVDNVSDGYILSKLSYQKFIDTGGELLGGEDNVLGRVSPDVQTSDVDGATLKYTDTDKIIGNDPLGTGNIDLSAGSWYFGGESIGPNTSGYFPNDNVFYQWSGAPDAGNQKRSKSIAYEKDGEVTFTELASSRLGFGDLTFDSLYNHNHTSKIDDRLFLRDGGFSPGAGWRGNEPYIVHNIPEGDAYSAGESTEDDFATVAAGGDLSEKIGGLPGNVLNYGGRVFPMMRGLTDLVRLSSWFLSGSGLAWWAKQSILQRLNPRNKRNYNPLSLFSGIPLGGNIHLRMDRGIFTSPTNYSQTVYELMNVGGLLGAPNEIANAVLLGTNQLVKLLGEGFVGGAAFQVLGLNRLGQNDSTNVAPPSVTILDQFGVEKTLKDAISIGKSKFSWDSQTRGGGLGNDTNPRALAYKEQYRFTLAGVATPDLKLSPAGGKLRKGASLDPFNVPGLTGIGQQLDKKQVNLKPYKNIPDLMTLPGAHRLGDIAVEGLGERYESKVTDKISDSLDSTKLSNFIEKPLPGELPGLPIPVFHRGGFFTNLPVSPGETLEKAYGTTLKKEIESNKNGYPVYFKDLRDNTYIFFRGYIEGGMNETVSAEWSPESFVGRSEDAYTYQKSSRDISFTLKLFAQSRSELDSIYDKIQKLTSLCYPQYKFDDVNFNGSNKLRMKPPLTKFRFGDLYGKSNNEMNGFIQTLTYTFPDDNLWEHENGHRVPKHITVSITYKVLHKQVPNMITQFYGKDLVSNIHYIKDSERKSINGE